MLSVVSTHIPLIKNVMDHDLLVSGWGHVFIYQEEERGIIPANGNSDHQLVFSTSDLLDSYNSIRFIIGTKNM